MTPWTESCQTSLLFTVSQSLLKLMSIESVMQSNHLILCYPLLLLPSFFSKGWLFASDGWSIEASTLASVLLMNIHNWFPLRLTGLISLLSKGLSRVFSSTTIQFSLVQSLSCVWLFVTAWTTAYKASLSITNLQSLLKLHWIDDAIQSLPLLLSPSPPAFNLSQHQDLF